MEEDFWNWLFEVFQVVPIFFVYRIMINTVQITNLLLYGCDYLKIDDFRYGLLIMLHFQFEITFDISTMKWTFGKVIFKIEGFQAIFNNIFRGKIAGIFCWILENWFKYLECGIVVIGKFKCQIPRENLLVWTFRLYNSIRVLITRRKKKSEAFFILIL